MERLVDLWFRLPKLASPYVIVAATGRLLPTCEPRRLVPTPDILVLHAHNLTKRFGGFTAVDDLTLNVAPGEVYALLGPNGAGKTTTINLFLGFLTPDAGEVRVGDVVVHKDPQAARRLLAYLPEQVALYPALSGIENLHYFAALAGHDLDSGALREALRQAGLQDEAHERRVETYSKGMRQKIGIALALARGAKALLLDEPTSGLDPAASYEFAELLRRLAGEGVAVLMATHDLFRVQDVANRVGLMRDGQLVREIESSDLPSVDLQAVYLEHVQAAVHAV